MTTILVHDAIVWSPVHPRGAAWSRPAHDGAETAIRRDRALSARGAAAPWCARLAGAEEGGPVAAAAVVQWLFEQAERYVRDYVPAPIRHRVGLAFGTSSGGMDAAERCFEALDRGASWTAPEALYAGPIAASSRGASFAPAAQVFAACASSSVALGLAMRWLERGACDVAFAGGYDVVTAFVQAGFEALRAVALDGCVKPFDVDRHGMALGEGACLVVLAREGALRRPSRARLSGFGASADAHHVTAPDPSGAGLSRAIEGATASTAAREGDVVSAHGTATPYNDAAELAALTRTGWSHVPLVSAKAVVGHTLGASGALESVLALEAADAGLVPAVASTLAPLDGACISAAARASRVARVLKLSCAFGGQNAALLFEVGAASASSESIPRTTRPSVHVSRAVTAAVATPVEELAERFARPSDKLARADELVRLALSAAARLTVEPGGRTGIVVGHGLATMETNARFWNHITKHGMSRAEPRRFPYTSPNMVAGELALALGARGPAFAVGGGRHGGVEALAMACELVWAGDADTVVVVAVDEVDAVARALSAGSRAGAVACVVSVAGGHAEVTSWASGLSRAPRLTSIPRAMSCHQGLEPLALGEPTTLSGESGWGAFAHVALNWAK